MNLIYGFLFLVGAAGVAVGFLVLVGSIIAGVAG